MKRFRGQVVPGTFAVVFTSQQSANANGYEQMADRMVDLAEKQPGFVGIESVHDESGFGITVSYWESEEAIRAWKANAEHQEAQKRGREEWYESFDLRICRVNRAYSGGAHRE